MYKVRDESCCSCKFWEMESRTGDLDSGESEEEGVCRRSPPVLKPDYEDRLILYDDAQIWSLQASKVAADGEEGPHLEIQAYEEEA